MDMVVNEVKKREWNQLSFIIRQVIYPSKKIKSNGKESLWYTIVYVLVFNTIFLCVFLFKSDLKLGCISWVKDAIILWKLGINTLVYM